MHSTMSQTCKQKYLTRVNKTMLLLPPQQPELSRSEEAAAVSQRCRWFQVDCSKQGFCHTLLTLTINGGKRQVLSMMHLKEVRCWR